MIEPQECESKKVYGRIDIAGHATGHLGDIIKYGDTFNITHVENATFHDAGALQIRTTKSSHPAAITFTYSAKLTLALGQQLIQVIESRKGVAATSGVHNVLQIWTEFENALHGVMHDVASRQQATNIDTLLKFQEACLDDIHGALRTTLYKLEKVNPTTDGSPSEKATSHLQQLFLTLATDLGSPIALFETSCQLLARLSESGQQVVMTTAASHAEQHSSLPLVHYIRNLLHTQKNPNDQVGPQLLDASSYEALESMGPITVSAQKAKRKEDSLPVILNDTAYPKNVPLPIILRTVQDLGRMLLPSEITNFGLPKCIGLIRRSPTSFCYVLTLPSDCHSPISLRSMYAMSEPSLTVKMTFANTLCKAVMFLHAADAVHKSIRPDNIIVTQSAKTQSIGLFLIGLEQIRQQSGHSALRADMQWYKNIYRHPSRQGLLLQSYYVMQHDIYSLGVCLLELGLWMSFVIFEDVYATDDLQPNAKLDPRSGSANQDSALELNEMLRSKPGRLQFQERLVQMAREDLPAKVGDIYTEVVVSCLTCADQDVDNEFDDSEQIDDDAGLLVGIDFMEKIMLRLGDIVL